MTYHTSLAQEPLGLNEQGNTEEWRMKYTPGQKADKMLTEMDIMWVDDGGTLEGRVLLSHQCDKLTDVIRSVAGRLEGVVQGCLLSKAKVGQFERGVALLGGVQQVLRLPHPR